MFTLNCRGTLVVGKAPMVMGIINLTPDSFYEGSRAAHLEAIIEKAAKMVAEGADIIDVGAQSTRPKAAPLSAAGELARIEGVFETLTERFPQTIFSTDTFFASVAHHAVGAGASIVNDISGGSIDPEMLTTVASLTVPFVCMHMKGTPQDMMIHAHYSDVVSEVLDYFIAKSEACRHAGIHDVIIDPGFGFSKNREQNLQLLHQLQSLKILGRPVLAGLSRKSTIYKTLGVDASQALNGTTVMNTIALLNGADLLRVHDVREAREAIALVEAYRDANGGALG